MMLSSSFCFSKEAESKPLYFSFKQQNGNNITVSFLGKDMLNIEPGCIIYKIKHIKHNVTNELKFKMVEVWMPYTFEGELNKEKASAMKGKIYLFKFKNNEILKIIEDSNNPDAKNNK